MMEQPYYVISPSYETSGSYALCEPPEYGADVVEVEARTKREAVIKGVKILLEKPQGYGRTTWASTNRSDGQSPFAGYKAEVARCGHGNPHFVIVGGQAVYMRCWGCAAPPDEIA